MAIWRHSANDSFALNLMPCVLPVLSIKLFAFTRQAGGGLREVRLGSAATAAGITFSFMLLAACLIGLKWSGASLGWGIQFQQPWFLAGMAVLTVLFAASFFEWLPIGLPGSIANVASKRFGGPMMEAFLTGVFATTLHLSTRRASWRRSGIFVARVQTLPCAFPPGFR